MVEYIADVLRKAEVPQKWYSIGQAVEARICAIEYADGIHVFIPERGSREGEKVYQNWREALTDMAQSFEPSYTDKIIELINSRKERD